ncbi:MAG: GNAT family N-acetyltransferase [Clostridia bacterium]|nr:GNAT family N-acetyltransferase [Clostridia bacterium]
MDIIKLEPGQKRNAAEVAAAAFFNYPMMIHYFPDAKRRRRWLPWYMERTLHCAMRYGEVYITSDISGVLFLLPPGHTRLTTGEFIKNGFLLTPIIMGFRNYRKSDECEKYVADTQERLMNGRKHYYLWGLVADPKTQYKGIGSALLQIATGKADAENMPVYLETHDQKNVAYYKRYGFQLIHTDTIPEHGLDIWCMLKEAGGV